MKRGIYLAISLVAAMTLLVSLAEARKVARDTLTNIGPALEKQFTFEPFTPSLPDHLWMNEGAGRIYFLHFDKSVDQKEARLLFIGEGVKGRFCVEDQPDGGKTGFVHFHAMKGPDEHTPGHGGQKAAQEGYWLKHIAVSEFDMMGMHFTPGIANNFMVTPAPKCG